MARTLLLVDDSVTIQRVVELSFAHEDLRIVSMSDGQRALQWLEVDKPDIVVVDVGVPEVDGYTVATRVKNAKRTKDVPVLLLAGAFEPVDEKRVRDIGCDGVIVKPFEPKQLVERVKELIDVTPIKAPRPAAVHGAPPAMSAAAAAVANPPALRAVRSMPPPEPEPVPVREPEPVMAVAAATPVVTDAPPAAPVASGTGWINPDPHGAAEPRRVEPVPAMTPAPVRVSSAPTPTAVESTSAPVASRTPQPLELPSRPMWSGGATPPVAPLGAAGASLSAPQASAKAALVNAFSALLAVDPPPAPPAPPPPPAAPTVAVLSEHVVEAAVRRVLEQMTEEQVRKIVAETAERLVREEIDRIIASSDEAGS
jgi:CheY-like chemotaxis protein